LGQDAHVWYVEITKLPPSWTDDEAAARDNVLAKLKEMLGR